MSEQSAFDLEKVYDEKISPLMDQIIAICDEHKIPFAATFQYATDGYCTTVLCDRQQGFLASDKMLQVANMIKPLPKAQTFAFTETTVENPDGSKSIRIKRVL